MQKATKWDLAPFFLRSIARRVQCAWSLSLEYPKCGWQQNLGDFGDEP